MIEQKTPILKIEIDKKIFELNETKNIVLKNIIFSINEGDFFSLLGTSGIGKTTLLRIISGLDTNYDGKIVFNGKEGVKSVSSFVFQEHRLIPWLRVDQNIGFALSEKINDKIRETKIKKVLSLVGLEGHDKLWPKELSGGMAQRVSIARALVNDPKILLLDEPFASLDAFTKKDIQSELKRIVIDNNITCIMITHDFDEAIFLSDNIVILGESPATIKTKKNYKLTNPNDRSSVEFNEIRKWLNDEFFGS